MKKYFLSVLLFLMLFSLVGWVPLTGQPVPPFPRPYPSFPFVTPPEQEPIAPQAVLNPLTGLPVADPDLLDDPTAMLSITNWPVSVRPQAGLSYAAMVYELYIGDGQSRFFSLFYGDFPPENQALGPLRSGRLPYEPLRQLYHGYLVMAYAWKGVLENLSDYNNYFSTDNTFSSAFVTVDQLKEIASRSDEEVDPVGSAVNLFETAPPPGGARAGDFWFIYNASNQVHWQFDSRLESYIRYQDQADGITFAAATDRLNGETLTYENVIMLFADHRYCTPYAFEIDLMYMDKAPALLFRDGRVYKIFWSTKNSEYERRTGKLRPIRFVDQNGNPFPLKPGQTWVHLVPSFTRYWETPQTSSLYSLLNNEQPGSGVWVSRFYESLMVYDEEVCNRIR